MSEEQDHKWTLHAMEKEKAMAYDINSPQMNRGETMTEPMKAPQNVFEVLSELQDTVARIDDLENQKHRLVSRYRELMESAQGGFSNIMDRPQESAITESEGFGKPRFGF